MAGRCLGIKFLSPVRSPFCSIEAIIEILRLGIFMKVISTTAVSRLYRS